jgi:glycosyltransferase involved in cell wall biosynthesis
MIYVINNYTDKIKIIILKKGRKYLDICLQNDVRIVYTKIEPKISVIIPIYNCQNSIRYTIISIQNQIMSDYEIILINDFSKDNSKKIIENYREKEHRIIIINNKKNMGTLYSRNIGVLAARGKYIFPLDNDDMLFNPELFWLLYKVGIKHNYDIIGFKAINGLSYNSSINNIINDPFINNKKNKVVHQPKLKFLSLDNNDCHIWGKFIKNEIYKNAINLLGIERYSVYLCIGEDDIMVFLLFSSAKTYKFYPIYGLFHLQSNITTFYTISKEHKLFARTFYLEILFDFTKNNFKEKKYVISFAILLSKTFDSKQKKNIRLYFKKVLNKILKCHFIDKKNKNYLLDIVKNI